MANRQTPVEWLIQRIIHSSNLPIETINDLIFQSIAIEKDEIGRAYQEGLLDGMNHSPKDYYNRTYGK